MQLPQRRKSAVLTLAVVTVVVVAIGTFSTLDWDEYNQNAVVARRSRAIAESAQRALVAIENLEAADFGYLFTGDAHYLESTDTSRRAIERSLTELSQPGSGLDSPSTVASLRRLVDDRLQELHEAVELRRSHSAVEAAAYLDEKKTRQKIEELRDTLNGIVSSQTDRFAARALLARQHAARTRLIVLIGTIVLALMLVVANIHIHSLGESREKLIAELERARDREEQAKNVFETTLESIGDAVISVDGQERIQFVNSAAQSLISTPIERGPSVLSEILQFIDEKVGHAVSSPAADAMSHGSPAVMAGDALLLTNGGRRLPIDASASPLRDRQGEIAGAVLVLRDVSPQREAQRRLEESERLYRLLFESNPLPMWVYDVRSLKFLEVNQSAIEHYGYSRDEFLQMSVADIRPAEDVPQLLRDIEHAPGATRHIAGPRRHCKKDGTVIYVEITDHSLVFRGRDAIIVLAHDITHRAQLEEQLRQSQKLEAVGQLAGGVAHDFNNMLTVISGYAEFLGDSPRTTAEDRGAITEIAGAAERARSLTQQLLAFSRRQVLQPKVFRLADSVRNIQKMLARLLGEDIELQTVLAEDSWNVSADPGQIDQILMNLAINARDAMENGGTLTVEVSNVLLDADYAATHVGVSSGEYVRLSVTDTGHGMDAETKARLFEPFFTTKEVGKGTGLGLSTVYGIVKQTGGNIWVYSEPGQGTTFAVYLPRSAAPIPTSPVRHRPSPAPPTGQVVLLVEDDPSVCKMVSAMITNSGYLVMSAKSMDEALHHTSSSQRIDLLLCDMVLPHVSGPAIAEKVLSLRPGLPVLFMSGYTEHAVLRQQGINDNIPFLQKPFSREALINKIRSMLTPVNGSE